MGLAKHVCVCMTKHSTAVTEGCFLLTSFILVIIVPKTYSSYFKKVHTFTGMTYRQSRWQVLARTLEVQLQYV